MGRHESNDRIYRLQGRFIDRRGKENLIHARYVAWGLFFGITPVAGGLLWAIPGGPKLSTCIVLGPCAGVVLAFWIANQLRGDVTLRSLWETWLIEGRTWLACRWAAAQGPRDRAARVPRTRRIRLNSEVHL